MTDYRLLNKATGQDNLQGTVDFEVYDQDWYPFAIVAQEFDGKYVVWDADNKKVIEKPVDLENLKQQKISEVQNAYTNSFLNGLDTSIGIKLHIKPEDQLNYIGAMIAAASFQDSDTLPFPVIDFLSYLP